MGIWCVSDGCFQYLKGDIKKAQTTARTIAMVWIPIYYPNNAI